MVHHADIIDASWLQLYARDYCKLASRLGPTQCVIAASAHGVQHWQTSRKTNACLSSNNPSHVNAVQNTQDRRWTSCMYICVRLPTPHSQTGVFYRHEIRLQPSASNKKYPLQHLVRITYLKHCIGWSLLGGRWNCQEHFLLSLANHWPLPAPRLKFLQCIGSDAYP